MDALGETSSNGGEFEVVRKCTISALEPFKHTNHPTASELAAVKCPTEKTDCSREDTEKTEREASVSKRVLT